jgi:CheY-like chemotaxis protein
MMPNMNGYELLDALRSDVKTQLIPVILLSARASEDSKIKGKFCTIKLLISYTTY